MFPVSDAIPLQRRPVVSLALIALVSAVFLYELQLDRGALYDWAHAVGFVPAARRWHTLFTSLAVHDGWVQFATTILYLWLFGSTVEDRMGSAPFLVFVAIAGAAGGLLHAALNPGSLAPLVGAAPAIAGILGAYFVLYPRGRILTAVFLVFAYDVLEVPAVFFLGLWLMLQVVGAATAMGAQGPHPTIGFDAQAAALAIGLVTGALLRRAGYRWRRAEPAGG